ncbi:hypothetical protein BYT27DRAFT_7181879 [Phlegmacium glaucopus]|nr:hypothetical protein BYT27DRAFT_7181879 [Phlegmacium glaucopus]
MPQTVPLVLSDISDTIFVKYVGFASFIILLWDHVDTFADEVEYIWKGKRKGICKFIYLFLFNRYFTPLGFLINLHAYLSPVWTLDVNKHRKLIMTSHRCSHFVRYEGCTVAIAVEVVGLMMLLRINALYPHQKWISRSLALILILETLMNAWLISRGEPVIHNPNSGIHAWFSILQCTPGSTHRYRPKPILILLSHRSGWASASAWIPLLYDTIIFGLTLYRTVPPIHREEASYIIKRLLEDGLLYYSVIFSVTFVLTFMIVAAPPGTKNIAAQMEQLITINLKRAGDRLRDDVTLSLPKTLLFDRRRRRRSSSTQIWDHPFNTPEPPRLSADQMPLPPSVFTPDDMTGRASFSTAGHSDLIHKPPPLVVARPKIPYIPIV